VSQEVPVFAFDQRLLNVKVAMAVPIALSKIPTDVFTACTKWLGPTSPTGSGGWPAPFAAKFMPSNELIGLGIGAIGTVLAIDGAVV
jgi:hypothetical protein